MIYQKGSVLGRALIKEAIAEAGLSVSVDVVASRMAESFSDADLEGLILRLGLAADVGVIGRGTESGGHVLVRGDEHDRKAAALDAFFAQDFQNGYHSFKEAFCDITGTNPYATDGDDFNRTVLRESMVGAYDSGRRATESATTTTWSLTLGDSVTRRMVAEYNQPGLQDWRQIVSSMPPINDFRTQRVDRVGGYGALPTVAEGAPYQPLTTPTEEETTYALAKRGGTEDLTLEAIANDDVRWISRIPTRLGLAAARTLHDAIWDILVTNPSCGYDSVALFHASHGNTAAAALSYSNYVAQRAAMRRQVGFGDSRNLLDLTPSILVVPPELEGIADQLCRGENAPPATSPGATNVPNLAQGTKPIVKARLSDTNDWFLVGDPKVVPTIEVGFYLGKQDPDLFVQSDPTVGAAFSADKFTWKIRHIWGYTILDHRGFQRGTQ
jgi:hypothetical protein